MTDMLNVFVAVVAAAANHSSSIIKFDSIPSNRALHVRRGMPLTPDLFLATSRRTPTATAEGLIESEGGTGETRLWGTFRSTRVLGGRRRHAPRRRKNIAHASHTGSRLLSPLPFLCGCIRFPPFFAFVYGTCHHPPSNTREGTYADSTKND